MAAAPDIAQSTHDAWRCSDALPGRGRDRRICVIWQSERNRSVCREYRSGRPRPAGAPRQGFPAYLDGPGRCPDDSPTTLSRGLEALGSALTWGEEARLRA